MRPLETWNIDASWTLFLDRDGVINRRKINDYICNIDEFQFLPGTLEALKGLSRIFSRIIVVTNQQGIGKGLMTETDLQNIHQHMVEQVMKNGGRIDAVFFSPHLASENSTTRKPAIGMALKAKEQFPEIEFEKSIIVGDSLSDMEFGRRAGLKTVFVNTDDVKIDVNFTNLQVADLVTFVELMNESDQKNQ